MVNQEAFQHILGLRAHEVLHAKSFKTAGPTKDILWTLLPVHANKPQNQKHEIIQLRVSRYAARLLKDSMLTGFTEIFSSNFTKAYQ